jgi:hypothetical protein
MADTSIKVVWGGVDQDVQIAAFVVITVQDGAKKPRIASAMAFHHAADGGSVSLQCK